MGLRPHHSGFWQRIFPAPGGGNDTHGSSICQGMAELNCPSTQNIKFIPRTQMTLVLIGKGLVLEDFYCPKIEDKQVPGIHYKYH